MAEFVSNNGFAAPAMNPGESNNGLSQVEEILCRRAQPLMLIMDGSGTEEYLNIPPGSIFEQEAVLDMAIAKTHELFSSLLASHRTSASLLTANPSLSCTLLIVDEKYFSIRLFHLRTYGQEDDAPKLAAIIEPIVEPQPSGVWFHKVKEVWHLSTRELEVLEILMSGVTDKQIASQMTLSVETVRAYLKAIRAKLGVTTRTAIVHVVHEADNAWHRASHEL